MLTYNDLYEYLRKEKYSEQLQSLPKNFVIEFSEYMNEKRKQYSYIEDFSTESLREKKQIENALTLFKELMMRRKKKILNLVFMAAETGIMKKDFTDMLSFEKELFEEIMASVEISEKKLSELLNGKTSKDKINKMIIAVDEIDKFIDMNGKELGPYNKGELVNLENKVAEILVSGGKAIFVDEKE